MPEVSYVYPNLSQSHLKSKTMRGGLSERWLLAEEAGCEYFEIAGTLIKNKTEEKLTSLEIGDFLSENDVSLLYTQEEKIPKRLKYVLHTEPSISKPNIYGRRIQPPIKWYDKKWTSRYIDMIISITKYLRQPASVIEIHPGHRKNTFDDIASFIEQLIEAYNGEFKFNSLILLENRTHQCISTGNEIKDYWDFLSRNYPDLIEKSGIVLDVHQLFTETTRKFLEEFFLIPNDCLKAFHIHSEYGNMRSHGPPSLNDRIPWRFVFGKIKQIKEHILINPEIFQKDKVTQVIRFCKKMLE